MTDIEHDAFTAMGGPSEVIRGYIQEKLGDKQKVLLAIEKCDEIIAREQEKKKELEKLLHVHDSSPGHFELEAERVKKLDALLKKPLPKWTLLNKQAAIDAGHFKDWVEAETWIKHHQNGSELL